MVKFAQHIFKGPCDDLVAATFYSGRTHATLSNCLILALRTLTGFTHICLDPNIRANGLTVIANQHSRFDLLISPRSVSFGVKRLLGKPPRELKRSSRHRSIDLSDSQPLQIAERSTPLPSLWSPERETQRQKYSQTTKRLTPHPPRAKLF